MSSRRNHGGFSEITLGAVMFHRLSFIPTRGVVLLETQVGRTTMHPSMSVLTLPGGQPTSSIQAEVGDGLPVGGEE